ncbi:hypothetical protein DSO57_1028312 [Entomophthora muscae]|uniref:Uncharacterized protein n=1 Tax=Entomophthora muscae TaxID=34485 RepID=A0ACC2T1R7_9FUNG|nr:hypothetical protein DSO57_1028312 [Entomophthora muscae]
MVVAIGDTVYPQALFKQLPVYKDTTQTIEPYDMQLSINGRHKHFFPSQYSTTQSHNENTFLDTVCHEILHGMGISTSFTIENSFLSNYNYTTYNNVLVSFTVKLNPFEKHIYTSNGISIGEWVDEMNKENTKFNIPSPIRALYTEEHSESAQSITRYVQEEQGLYFRTKDGTHVYLETGIPFKAGTSIAHISSKYNITTDRLITRRSMNGQGIHDITREGWKTSPFGQRTLKILETMGYPLNPNPKYENSLSYFNHVKKNINRNTNTRYEDSPHDNEEDIKTNKNIEETDTKNNEDIITDKSIEEDTNTKNDDIPKQYEELPTNKKYQDYPTNKNIKKSTSTTKNISPPKITVSKNDNEKPRQKSKRLIKNSSRQKSNKPPSTPSTSNKTAKKPITTTKRTKKPSTKKTHRQKFLKFPSKRITKKTLRKGSKKPRTKSNTAVKPTKKTPVKPKTAYKPTIKKATKKTPRQKSRNHLTKPRRSKTPIRRLIKKKARKSSYYTKRFHTYYRYRP